jgi:hypothetical protein
MASDEDSPTNGTGARLSTKGAAVALSMDASHGVAVLSGCTRPWFGRRSSSRLPGASLVQCSPMMLHDTLQALLDEPRRDLASLFGEGDAGAGEGARFAPTENVPTPFGGTRCVSGCSRVVQLISRNGSRSCAPARS